MTDELWIILVGMLVSSSCALVGVVLVLRRLSMVGDAISHSILFGLVVAYLLVGTRSSLAMFIGAVLSGLFTTFITEELNRRGKLQKDASIGVTFTVLFAIGVILISGYASQIDLDQQCVLYGEIAFIPFDRLMFGSLDIGPRAFWELLLVLVSLITFLWVGFRPLQITAFDPVLSAALGIHVGLWHYLLMTFVSITTVASFESVGAILVVAMLVIPANTAYLIAKSIRAMFFYSVIFAIISTLVGYYGAKAYDVSISAAIVCASGTILFLLIIIKNVILSVQRASHMRTKESHA